MTPCVALTMLSSVIIFMGLFPDGLGKPRNKVGESDPLGCEENPAKIQNVIYYSKCTCDGKNRDTGTKCLKTETRPDNEESGRPGECANGFCVLKNVTRGCTEIRAISPGSPLPFGCAFFCDPANGVYGFFPVGTPCKHRKARTEYVNGTCQNSGDKVICTENPPPPPAC